MSDKPQIPDGPPIPMSEFTLGPREDISAELMSVEIGGVIYTDYIRADNDDAMRRMAAKLAEMNKVAAKLFDDGLG